MAVSLVKVADVDRNIGNEDAAIDGFQEGIKLLESLTLGPEEVALEQRVRFPSTQPIPDYQRGCGLVEKTSLGRITGPCITCLKVDHENLDLKNSEQ